ncbi:aminodeoxychorismate/anthranilate synthase component II, partial [Patescibacteria group bacterium]|nr:aminodeoxychorismate/anthranilate synthase component II [Patescibacteria group bacterium]
MKVLLIDHDDSFTHILAHYFPVNTHVLNHSEVTLEQIHTENPSHLVLSPGPGHPDEYKIDQEILTEFAPFLPILGVCLGHQAIAAHFGATVGRATQIMHGKKSAITHSQKNLFANLKNPLSVMRYHSLAVANLPEILQIEATAEDGTIMALRHKNLPIFGVQFHPESIGTEQGKKIIE